MIPQDFGRKIPTSINNAEYLQSKYDMLMVLSDIEMAQSMEKDAKNAKPEIVKTYMITYKLINLISHLTYNNKGLVKTATKSSRRELWNS